MQQLFLKDVSIECCPHYCTVKRVNTLFSHYLYLVFSLSSAEICEKGETGGEGATCVDCAADTYKDVTGRDACTPCEEGFSTQGAIGVESADGCYGKEFYRKVVGKDPFFQI